MDKIDTLYQYEITCPYCGYEDGDSWDASNSGITECRRCEKEFKYERDIEVTYSSYKLEGNNGTNAIPDPDVIRTAF